MNWSSLSVNQLDA